MSAATTTSSDSRQFVGTSSARQAGSLTVHAKRGDLAGCGAGGPWVLVGGPVNCAACRADQQARLHDLVTSTVQPG